jgi:DNA-directed RNA polymerase specialized sigma24 family protein
VDTEAEREFQEFVARRAGALQQAAYLLTGDRQHAEDLLQSALTRVALRWGRIRTSRAGTSSTSGRTPATRRCRAGRPCRRRTGGWSR